MVAHMEALQYSTAESETLQSSIKSNALLLKSGIQSLQIQSDNLKGSQMRKLELVSPGEDKNKIIIQDTTKYE